VDEIFVRLGVKLNYQRILLFNFLTTMSILILIVIHWCLGFNAYESDLGYMEYIVDYIPTYSLSILNITLMTFKFFCITRLARNRFRMINEGGKIRKYQEINMQLAFLTGSPGNSG